MTKDEALKLALKFVEDSECGTADLEAHIKEALAQPEQEPVAWMNNKDFEPIRVRIMQEAYELADRNDSEGYNAIKIMCGDVQSMLPPQRTWVGLTEAQCGVLWKTNMTPFEYYQAIEAKLKEKNT